MQILIATNNQGKVIEFRQMFADLELEWLGLADLPPLPDVEETGSTFVENACLKAETYARQTGLLTLSDDSGLVVDALDGAPGVYTARYGGPGLSHAERYQLMLRRLDGVAAEKRTARFCCVIALADPNGILETAEGVCEGMISAVPAGEGGFGYDPVFFLPQYGKTMAQITPALKNQISHRGNALRQIAPRLRAILQQ